MHLQNNSFIQYQCNVKILIQIHFSIPSFLFSVCDSTYGYRIRHSRQIQLLNPICLSFSSNVISHLTITVTFMTNSVGESSHVGHSISHFKSVYFYAVISLVVQIHGYMRMYDKHFE